MKSLIKLLDKVGKLLIKLYFRVSKAHVKAAKTDAKLSAALMEKSIETNKKSMEHLSEASRIADKAQSLSRLFDSSK